MRSTGRPQVLTISLKKVRDLGMPLLSVNKDKEEEKNSNRKIAVIVGVRMETQPEKVGTLWSI